MFAQDAVEDARDDEQSVVARSIQWHLGVLCTVFAVPILVFVGWLLWQYTGAERVRLEQQRIETLYRVATAVEQDLSSLKAIVELAATSPVFASSDPASAERPLRELSQALDMDIVLRTTSGEPLFFTGKEQDHTATTDFSEHDRHALQSGRAVIYTSVVEPTSAATIVITAAVMRPGARDPKYLLSFGVKPARTALVVSREEHPPGVVTTVLDSSGNVIATGGSGASTPVLSPLSYQTSASTGRYRTSGSDGHPIWIEHTRLPGTDWTVIGAVSEASLQAPLQRFLFQLAAIGAALGLLSPALAFTFGRHIYGALNALAIQAASLGQNQPVKKLTTAITQINEVGNVLYEAGRAINDAQERLAVLNRELHHRVKNTLATVQAVINLAGRSANSVDSFRDSLTSRISSLSATHDLLISTSWSGVPLRALLENELAAYQDDANSRIQLTGPSVQLPSEMAVPVGMIIHELATNAAKYGVLRGPGGRVAICWLISGVGSAATLSLEWQETDGPPSSAESGHGFGFTLLDRLSKQLSGSLEKELGPDGMRLRIVVPLHQDALIQT